MPTHDATATLRPDLRRRRVAAVAGGLSCLLREREALVTVTGPVDRAAVTRIEIMVHALRTAGAVHVLVDMLGVSSCDHALTAALHRQRRELIPRGGWLLVDGGPDALHDELDLSLADTFRIYREAAATDAAGVRGR